MLVLEATFLLMQKLAHHYSYALGGVIPFLILYALAFAGTTVISMISYKYLEKPFLVLKRSFTFIPSRAI
jgi:peptidoglycan/LPS O-acetylase OafA/YrhL